MPVGLSRDCLRQILTPDRPASFDFVTDHVRNHKGEPFNPVSYPWTKGICEAWDDPDVRSIALQFAARLGKTQLAQSLIISAIANEPATWMLGQATETLVKETIRDKYYPMFERCEPTRKWVPSRAKRIQTRVDLITCRGYAGWSGSPTSLADKDPKYLHAGEIDKWSKNISSEADPLELFLERGLEIPDRKVLIESTPAIANQSRIEAALKAGWDCRYYVPCPKCGNYDYIQWGEGFDKDGNCAGGVIWDRDEKGHMDSNLALHTARYMCFKCKKEWDDDMKHEICLKGQWVPKGQWLTKTGKIRGSMLNPGPDASYQLSRLYAPTFTFGDVARAYVIAHHGHEEKMRNWRNSWMGWTWTPLRVVKPWEEIAEMLCCDYPLQTVPEDGYFVTAAVDVQVDHWVFMACAWGSEQRGYVIDYGIIHSWDDVTKRISSRYPHADGGPALTPAMTLIDAKDGNRKDEVIYYCRSVNNEHGPFVWPYMGSTTNIRYPYQKTVIDDANNRVTRKSKKRHTEFGWITGNTQWHQEWINNCLYKRTPGRKMSLSFPESAKEDRDLWEQLSNEAPSISLDTTGHEKLSWVVVKPDVPVDFRDAARYNRCAAEVYLRGNWSRIPERRRISADEKPVPVRSQPARKAKPKNGWVRRLNNFRLNKGL